MMGTNRLTYAGILCAVVASVVPGQSSANYISNRADWNRLNPAQQSVFVMGALDSMTMLFQDDSKEDRIRKTAIFDCVVALNIRDVDLVQMLNEAYARDAARWAWPPNGLLFHETLKVCGPTLNRERAAQGLPPLPPVTD
jgi:hypothetical protein